MTTPEKDQEKAAPIEATRPTSPSAGDCAVHRPEEDIANKPLLKVRPMGSRTSADSPKPSVRGGTLFRPAERPFEPRPAEARPPEADKEETPSRSDSHADEQAPDVRFAYATHRSAPADEEAEKAELAALTGRKAEREISTGLLLGVALIVVALVGGIFVVRLNKKVTTLEQRLAKLETPRAPAAVLKPPAPAPRVQPAAKPVTRDAKPRTVSATRPR